jgi:hypothetical protein
MKIGQPDFLEHVLYLLSLVVLHQLGYKPCISAASAEIIKISDTSLEELSEIVSNGKINKYLLVKSCVIIPINSLYILDFWEVSKRV